ncbi:CAZyme family GH72 [Penicillium cf. griseofulvum]|nr:CAZyme family GH72 [Penicillium cf. griseofulvum]
MSLPLISVAGNALSGSQRFQVKGVAYIGHDPGSTAIDLATINPARVTGTPDGTHTSTSIRPRSDSTRPKQSRATMAGISVGATFGMLLLFTGAFFYFRRHYRNKNRPRPSSSLPQRLETAAGRSSDDAPLADLARTDQPNKLPVSDPSAQDLHSVLVYKAGKEEV